MLKKIFIVIGITILILIFAFFLVPILFSIIRYFIYFFGFDFLINLDNKDIISMNINILGIFLSITSILVSSLLVYFIYELSNQKENFDFLKLKNALYSQTILSIKNALSGNKKMITISETLISEGVKLYGQMDDKDIEILMEIWNILINIKDSNETEQKEHINALKQIIYVSFYELIDEKKIKNFYSLFNGNICKILNNLNPSKSKNFVFGISHYYDNSIIFEHYCDKNENKYKVYFFGNLKYNCSFDGKDPLNGFGCETNEKYIYIGEFKNKLRNGEGELYQISNKNDKLLVAKGVWNNGNLFNGEAHNVKSVYGENPVKIIYFFDQGYIEAEFQISVQVFSVNIKNGKVDKEFNYRQGFEEDSIKAFSAGLKKMLAFKKT